MLDHPRGPALLDAVARLLRDVLLPALPPGNAAFQARVAANAVDLAAREMRLGPAADAAAIERLQSLLQQAADGASLDALEAALALAIRSGAVDPDDAGLRAHLWAGTLDKLAIDQPSYAPYRRAVALRAGTPTSTPE
jgi:hypothetical protein